MPNVRSCRVASADWRPGRVYFLTLLEPLAGTTGLWPLPPGRPVSATVGELSIAVDRFTASAVDRTVIIRDLGPRWLLSGTWLNASRALLLYVLRRCVNRRRCR